MPPHHHTELRRNSGCGQHRCRLGCFWISQSAPRCVHTRFFRNDLHFELRKTPPAHFFDEAPCSRIQFPIISSRTRIEEFYGSDEQIFAGNEAACYRARHGMPRMLLRERREWQASRSGGLAQGGVACKRFAEARAVKHQRLLRTVRSSECGYHFGRQRHTMARGNNRVRPIPSYRRLGQPFQRCRCTPPSSQRISAAHATSIPLIEVCWKYAAGSVESGQVLVSRITV